MLSLLDVYMFVQLITLFYANCLFIHLLSRLFQWGVNTLWGVNLYLVRGELILIRSWGVSILV